MQCIDEQADIATWLRPKGPIFKGDAEAVEEGKLPWLSQPRHVQSIAIWTP